MFAGLRDEHEKFQDNFSLCKLVKIRSQKWVKTKFKLVNQFET